MSKGRSLQLVTTIYSTCHDDLPNLSRQFNQLVTTIWRLRAEDGEARVGKQRLTDNYKPSFIVDLEVSYQFLFLVLAESFWVSRSFLFLLAEQILPHVRCCLKVNPFMQASLQKASSFRQAIFDVSRFEAEEQRTQRVLRCMRLISTQKSSQKHS